MPEFALPLSHLLDGGHDPLQGFREDSLHQFMGNPAFSFVGRPSVKILCSAVPEKDPAIQASEDDRIMSQIEQGRPFPQFLLCSLLVTDIGNYYADALPRVFDGHSTER